MTIGSRVNKMYNKISNNTKEAQEELTPEELEELETLVYREPNETDNIFQTGEYTSGTIQRMTTDIQAGKVRRSAVITKQSPLNKRKKI